MTSYGDLNANERRVLAALGVFPATLRKLSWLCFPELPSVKANSCVRNSLRRPFHLGLIEHVGQGSYSLTAEGIACLFQAGDVVRQVRTSFRQMNQIRPKARKRVR